MNALDSAQTLLTDTVDIWYTSVWETFFGYGILSVLALLSSVGIVYGIKKILYPIDRRSPREKACATIMAITVDTDFYVRLIERLKYYLACYSTMPAHTDALTENELIGSIENTGNQELITLVVPVLEHAYAAKFAQRSFCPETCEQDRKQVLAVLVLIIPDIQK